MAGRFVETNTDAVDKFVGNSKNENTNKSTNTWIRQYNAWAKWKGKSENLESYTPEALDEMLCLFYAELKKCDGKDYEPDSLAVMQAALDRYLKIVNFSQENY